jgi:hypothetical protein
MAKGKGYRERSDFTEQIYELYKSGQSVPRLSSKNDISTYAIFWDN